MDPRAWKAFRRPCMRLGIGRLRPGIPSESLRILFSSAVSTPSTIAAPGSEPAVSPRTALPTAATVTTATPVASPSQRVAAIATLGAVRPTASITATAAIATAVQAKAAIPAASTLGTLAAVATVPAIPTLDAMAAMTAGMPGRTLPALERHPPWSAPLIPPAGKRPEKVSSNAVTTKMDFLENMMIPSRLQVADQMK